LLVLVISRYEIIGRYIFSVIKYNYFTIDRNQNNTESRHCTIEL